MCKKIKGGYWFHRNWKCHKRPQKSLSDNHLVTIVVASCHSTYLLTNKTRSGTKSHDWPLTIKADWMRPLQTDKWNRKFNWDTRFQLLELNTDLCCRNAVLFPFMYKHPKKLLSWRTTFLWSGQHFSSTCMFQWHWNSLKCVKRHLFFPTFTGH